MRVTALPLCMACAMVAAAASPARAQIVLPPGEITAMATAPGEVTIAWSESFGAARYNVYRSVAPPITFNPFPVISTDAVRVASGLARRTFVDSGLATLARYYDTVTATDANGFESLPNPFAPPSVMTTAPPYCCTSALSP